MCISEVWDSLSLFGQHCDSFLSRWPDAHTMVLAMFLNPQRALWIANEGGAWNPAWQRRSEGRRPHGASTRAGCSLGTCGLQCYLHQKTIAHWTRHTSLCSTIDCIFLDWHLELSNNHFVSYCYRKRWLVACHSSAHFSLHLCNNPADGEHSRCFPDDWSLLTAADSSNERRQMVK